MHRPLHPTCTHVLRTLECSERRVGAKYVNWMIKHVISTHLYCAYCDMFLDLQWRIQKFRKGGSATGALSASKNFGVATPTSGHANIRTEYLETTLGLVNRLEISKELIRECVTVPGCCCCIPLLYNHLIDLCNYLRKNALLAAKGGVHVHPPLPPSLNPPLTSCHFLSHVLCAYM